MDENKPELRFCRLCGKERPAKDFSKILLARIPAGNVVYDGCKGCATTMHNAVQILKEFLERVEKKIQEAQEPRRTSFPRSSFPKT